jgi:hypothetical protein
MMLGGALSTVGFMPPPAAALPDANPGGRTRRGGATPGGPGGNRVEEPLALGGRPGGGPGGTPGGLPGGGPGGSILGGLPVGGGRNIIGGSPGGGPACRTERTET